MSLVEIVAAVSGLICVWLTVKENIWSWPIGLVQVALYVYVFIGVKLYSDAILQVFFIVTSIYGWYQWLRGGANKTTLRVSVLGNKFFKWILLCLVIFPVWAYFMKKHLGAAAPYPDSFILVASILATYLMAKKRLECWVFWISVDVVAIGVYLYKNLLITSGLYAVFLILAILGYKEWRKSYALNPVVAPASGNAV